MVEYKNKIFCTILIVIVAISMLSSAAEPEPTGTPKTPTITMNIFPVKTPTNITTQLIKGSGMADGCKGGDPSNLRVTVNGLAATIDLSTNTYSKSISLSEGVNTVTVTATIGICSITKTTSILLDTSSQTLPDVTADQIRYIDVHTHINPSGMPLSQIIQNMDKEGIDKMVIMKVPADMGETQAVYGIPDAAEQSPSRFIALYGGEAITMLESAATSGNYTKADEEKYTTLLEREMKSGKYKGFGEIGLRHFVPKQSSEAANLTIPGDHPWMFIMSDIAARYNVPIDIHMEATDETIRSFERLLDHNKSTKIIWDHAGWSNTGKATPQLMRQLMEKHPNLYSSIKIRAPDTPGIMAVSIFDNEFKIKYEWMALFKDYPDRFMIGSDIKLGIRADDVNQIKNHRSVLKQLPPEILKKIERENAEEIFIKQTPTIVTDATANQTVVIPDGNQSEIDVETINTTTNTTTVKPTGTVDETPKLKPTPELLSGFDIVNVIFALFGDEKAKIRQEANVLNNEYNTAVENEDWDNIIPIGEKLKLYITDSNHYSVLNENGWVDKVLGILIDNAVLVAKNEPALTPTNTATPTPTPTITETQTTTTPSTTSLPQPTSASISSTTMKYKGEYKINSNTVEWFSVGLGGYWKCSVSAVIPFEITLKKQEWGKKFNGETKVRVNWAGQWGEKDTLVKKTSVTGTLAGTGDVKISGEFDPEYPDMVLIKIDEGNFFTHTYVQDPKPLNKDDLGYNLDMFVKPGGMFYGPLFDEQVAFWDAATSKNVLGKFKTTGSSVTVSKSGKELGLMAGNYLNGGQFTITADLTPTN